MTFKIWVISSGDALSQFINNFVFLAGNANQALSSRCWDQRDHWFFGTLRYPIDGVAMLFGQRDHCAASSWNEIARAKTLIAEH